MYCKRVICKSNPSANQKKTIPKPNGSSISDFLHSCIKGYTLFYLWMLNQGQMQTVTQPKSKCINLVNLILRHFCIESPAKWPKLFFRKKELMISWVSDKVGSCSVKSSRVGPALPCDGRALLQWPPWTGWPWNKWSPMILFLYSTTEPDCFLIAAVRKSLFSFVKRVIRIRILGGWREKPGEGGVGILFESLAYFFVFFVWVSVLKHFFSFLISHVFAFKVFCVSNESKAQNE